MKALVRLGCAALLVTGLVRTAPAEVFVLANGGRVVGELLNPEEPLRQTYVIRTSQGVELTLDRAQVKQVQRSRPDEQEYEKLAPRYTDTVAGQWALAEWCGEHKLRAQREVHLRRVIELDPNHVDARRALGYAKYGNQWKTLEEAKTERGLILDRGEWILPQEKQAREEKREVEAAERAWVPKLRRMIAAANDSDSRDALATISDPVAVVALGDAMKRESRDEVRILLVQSLGRIGNAGAIRILADCAMEDQVAEVRHECLQQLKRNPAASSGDHFVGFLRNKDNAVVNRAGEALKYVGGPSAISPLINALVTTHKRIVMPPKPNASFDNRGGTNLSAGGGPVEVKYQVENRAVLEALVALTGVNFGFDEKAWSRWHAAHRREGNTNTRRDEDPAAAPPTN